MAKTKNRNKIPLHVSIRLRYLYQDKGIVGKELLNMYPMYSKSSIYRHATREVDFNVAHDKRKNNKGRPSKLTDRDKRAILRQVPILRETVGSFTTKRLRVTAGIGNQVCDKTIRRVLRSAGYGFYHSRKKGLLKKKDLKDRLQFARKVKRLLSKKFWTEGISFYLDAAGFLHKYNPFDEAQSTKTMAWRRRDEGLDPHYTAKGSHVGSGGRVAHFMVAIGYGKGVILAEKYYGNINGQMFAEFVKDHFPETVQNSSNPRGKLFLQDGDPSQNSRLASDAMTTVGAKKFSIPARSPDMNPIENVFNFVKLQLHSQALGRQLTKENFEEFSNRVKETLKSVSVDYINKTIESMDPRMSLVIKAKGKRIKY